MKAPDISMLKGLKLPESIGIWPLAYGWYVTGFLILSAITCLFFLYRHWQRKRAPIKSAIKELEAIHQRHKEQINNERTTSELLTLIKRFLMVYQSREEVAPLYGKTLSEKLGNPDWCETLIQTSYKKNVELELDPIIEAIHVWLRKGKHV